MIEKAKFGNDGPQVGRLGYGAMVLEGYYGESDDDSAVETLLHAIDSGMMVDSADAYGNGHNESLGQACLWNKKHLDHPFATNATESFQKKTKDWENFFSYLN